jgi:hypothetical protein
MPTTLGQGGSRKGLPSENRQVWMRLRNSSPTRNRAHRAFTLFTCEAKNASRYSVCWIDLPSRLIEALLENERISDVRRNRQEARKRKCLDTSV